MSTDSSSSSFPLVTRPEGADVVTGISQLGFTFREDATTDQLLAFGQSLCVSRAFLKFALGSFFLALVTSLTRTASIENREKAFTEAEDYARAFAVAHAIDQKEFREIFGVARFYHGADLSQCGGLGFEHLREAMWGAASKHPGGGMLPAALGYLTLAREREWRYTELRRFIRTRDAVPAAPRQMELAQYGAVFDFMRFAKRELQEVHNYSPERARIILADLGESTFLYLDALRALAGSPKAGLSRSADFVASRG